MKWIAWWQKYWILVCILLIMALAAGLRFYQLGQVPQGMTWDEAATGYNGWAIWTIHRDEWLHFMPISFKSFGDYKAPLPIYITGFLTWALGMELWVIRIQAAVSGVISVAGIMWLTWEVTHLLSDEDSTHRSRFVWWSLVAGLLVAITPWHIHLTRFAMESGTTMVLVTGGTAAWIHSLRLLRGTAPIKLKNWARIFNSWWQKPWLWQLVSVVWLSLSLYSYHSAKIMVPLLGVTLLLLSWKELWRHKQLLVLGVVSVSLLLAPLVYDSVYGGGSERLSQAGIKTEGKSTLEIASLVITNFSTHFTPYFLVEGQTTTVRHGDGTWGVLLWPTLALVLVGLLASSWPSNKSDPLVTKMTLWAILWIVIGTFPAAIGQEVPHANRAFLAMSGWMWLAIMGLDWLLNWASHTRWDRQYHGTHGETQLLAKTLLGLVILSHALFLTAYLHHYYTDFARNSAADFQEGYLEAIRYVLPYEKGDATHPEVDKIIIDNGYGQPYIFVLLARRTNPIWYHGGSLIKYEFPDRVDSGSLLRPRSVVVATGLRDMPWAEADHLVYGSDGQIRFGIFVNQD